MAQACYARWRALSPDADADADAIDRIDEWRRHYNNDRPHTS
ncbi:MAG: transposase, partial [Afipia sp.]|nr:transposase [Afipia sp.]